MPVKEVRTGQRAGPRRPASPGLIALVLGVPVALAAVLVALIVSLSGSRPAPPPMGQPQAGVNSLGTSNPDVSAYPYRVSRHAKDGEAPSRGVAPEVSA